MGKKARQNVHTAERPTEDSVFTRLHYEHGRLLISTVDAAAMDPDEFFHWLTEYDNASTSFRGPDPNRWIKGGVGGRRGA